MTTSSRETVAEERRSHRSLARKLAWHRASLEARELTVSRPVRSSWLSRTRTGAAQGAFSGRLAYFVYLGGSRLDARVNLLVEDIFDESALRFYLVGPSLLDPESYEQNREEVKDLYLVRPHHGAAQWQAVVQSLRQLDQTEEQQGIARPADVENSDPFWDQVPTEEILRRHPNTSVEDPSELKLELWDSDQEFETFLKGIDEARRSDTI